MMRITPINIAKIQFDSNYSFEEIYHVLWKIHEKRQQYMPFYCKIVEDLKREYCRAEFFFYDTKILTLMLCNYNNYLFMERYTSFDDLIFDGEFIKSQQIAARPLSKSTEPLSHDVYLDPQIIDKQYNQTLIVPDFLDRSLQEHLNLWMIVIPWILISIGNIIVACRISMMYVDPGVLVP
uniref:Uncharacterized protein n=1 Tax=Acrobeloides nanus TaxID=290746 RepID=A0A914E7T1_9BILA